MTQYILETDKCTVLATYSKAGKLKKLDAKKGFLVDANHYHFEKDIDKTKWRVYDAKSDPFYKPALSTWLEFYKSEAKLDYRFRQQDGKALKEIGKFLTQVAGSSQYAIETWKYILKNWHRLDPFYRNSMDLSFINSQLNKILNLLKNGKQTSKADSHSHADDLRSSFKQRTS